MGGRVDLTEVERIRGLLEQAPDCATKVSRAKAIRMLAPQFRKLRARGYTVKDIAGLLRDLGLTISVESLRTYLGAKRIGVPTRKGSRATPSVTPAGAEPATSAAVLRVAKVSAAAPAPTNGAAAGAVTPKTNATSVGAKREVSPTRATFTPREDSDDL